MKTSIAIATFLVAGVGAAGVAALPNPYQGSDTLFDVTRAALKADDNASTYFGGVGPAAISLFYVGGGSGNAATAMVKGTQLAGPMSRMIKSEGGSCTFNGAAGAGDNKASGIVIGLDGVDIYAANVSTHSTSSGGTASTAACNGATDGSGSGLAYSGTAGVFHNGAAVGVNTAQTWKWMLALLYGGNDFSQTGGGPNGLPDCGQASRMALVANWSSLFQGAGCANGTSVCGAAPQSGQLWHAFRRDDTSGTSDVFATILGLSPSTSSSSLSGFGASPYCNAMNWDVSTANANCASGAFNQFTGPGGIQEPGATDAATKPGNHRRPPAGTFGDNPNSSAIAKVAADVLPTQMQDNDPIRRPCLGVGKVSNDLLAGEEVCNLDGQLGLVVPMVDSDWIPLQHAPLLQYPTTQCKAGFVVGTAPTIFTCAPNGHTHTGECSNGDALFAGGCLLPTATGTSQCMNNVGNVPALTADPTCTAIGQKGCVTQPGFPVATALSPGLAYNITMRDGTVTDGTVTFLQYPIPAIASSVDFLGAYNRIHQSESVLGSSGGAPLAAGCQMTDMTDQIACLSQADPCSIGYAGDGGKGFATNPNDVNGAAGPPGGIDSMRVAQIYPKASSVQLLGQAGEYQIARKLYFNSLAGFTAVSVGGVPVAGDTDEFLLAKFESSGTTLAGQTTNINAVLQGQNEFTLGLQFAGSTGVDPQFCEDFNEQIYCANVIPATTVNQNGCLTNPAGVPGGAAGIAGSNPGTVGANQVAGTSTVCGDGIRQAYEECDNGTLATPANSHATGNSNSDTTPGGCSVTCRCIFDFNEVTGQCN